MSSSLKIRLRPGLAAAVAAVLSTRRRLAAFGVLVVAAASLGLAVGVAEAGAVIVDAPPAWPISAGAPPAPPPIPALPAAGDVAPPVDQIADPVTPAASCGGWSQQSNYGARWPTGSTWWEYQCLLSDYQYHDMCAGGGACDAWCPDCWWEESDWTDYFYWNGSEAVFYGESYTYSTETVGEEWDGMPPHTSGDWWDAPTAQWYNLGPTTNWTDPNSGPVGTSLTIYGSGFTDATSVAFNGVAAGFTVYSDQEIGATVPAGATTGAISMTTPNGTEYSSAVFTVTAPPPPTINSLAPTSGPVGTSVDVQGTNLSGATSVTFNGTADTSFVVNSSSDITAYVPAGATTGPISVTTPAGTGTSSTPFTVIPPPTITSFTPTSGPVGTSVPITGTGFTGASSVTFNGTAASYVINSPTSISATVPTGATTGPTSVTTPGGTASSSTSFTVIPPPTISSFTPTSGPAGTRVTIQGTNFASASAVKLGTTTAKFTANSPTTITATVPTIAHGYYKWSVTNPAGTATSTGSFHVT
jgi:hypothetical protein